MVQWLSCRASSARGAGLIPGQGTKIPHALQRGQKKKKNTKERTTSHSLFPYLQHLHSPVMQPVWPGMVWLMVADGHVLTLWKTNMNVLVAWPACFEVYG